MNTHKTNGFTVVELIFAIVILVLAGTFFFIQKNNITVAGRDQERKTAINAMFYSLEEVYYKEHNHYPRTITEEILPSVDPAQLTDPFGIKIGEPDSDYRYEPTDCNNNDECQSYTLRASLEHEDNYIKQSRNR